MKRIIFLSISVFAIIAFWLAPGINTAGDVKYTRRYEDTDATTAILAADTARRKSVAIHEGKSAQRTKKYKTETLNSSMKISKVRPKHFSRAIQFVEEDPLNDSSRVLVVADTTAQIQ